MRVCVALVLVLALSAVGSAERRGFAADFQRRAAAHVNAANARGGGHSHPRFAALADAMNAGLPGGSSGSGSGRGGHKRQRPVYDPMGDAALSLPALDYTPKAALTELSLQSPLPTLRPQDLASTTLTAPWPDPIAPSAADIPHAVAPPQAHAVFAPRFRQLSGSGDGAGADAAAGAAADAVNSIVSPDGGALSPLRPHEPAFDAAPPPSRRRGRGDGAEPYRHVIPIELSDEQLEAAQHPPSEADLMRFATRPGRGRGGAGKDTPMAFTESGPIAPYGPLARHHRFQNKPRNIFGKRVTIQLPIAGSADAQASAVSVAARTAEWKALARANVKGGPFDPDNAEVDSDELDAEPQLTHRAPTQRGANVAAPPPQPFDAAEADASATEAVDATEAVFLQTGTVSQQRARHFRRADAPAVMRAGDTLLYRVDPRGRRHSSTHFRHRYREADASRAAAEADAYDDAAQARAAAFVSMRERARVERERTRSAQHTLSSPLELPARNAPPPHAHFPSAPLNLDSFDPFEGGRGAGKRMPHSPSRPMPPPMVRGPAARANPRGTLHASTFLATHATVKRDAKAGTKGKGKAQAKANAKAAETTAAEAAKAAAKKLAETKAKAAADAAAKKAAAAQAKAAAEKAAAAKAAAAQAAAQAVAQAQAQAQAAAPDMLRLMQRLQADAGVDAAALTAGSAAAQLQALRRIEGAVRAAEERVALQAQVDALQAQVSGLMQLQLQRQQQQPQPVPAVSLMETAATAQAADADAEEAGAEAEAEATEETADTAAAETEGESETETESESAAETEAAAESSEAEAEGEADATEAEAEGGDASTAAPADAEAALAAAEAAADAQIAAEVEGAE